MSRRLKKTMSSWSYRVMVDKHGQYGIREAYTNDDGDVDSYGEASIAGYATVNDLIKALVDMLVATERVEKPRQLILQEQDFEEEPQAQEDDPIFRLVHGLTCENFGQKNPYDTQEGEDDGEPI